MEFYEEISGSEDESTTDLVTGLQEKFVHCQEMPVNEEDKKVESSAELFDFSEPFDSIGGAGMMPAAEMDTNQQRVGESAFWTQSIAPGKFYKRHRSGSQLGTSALQSLQKEFDTNILQTISAGKVREHWTVPTQAGTSCCSHHKHPENEAISSEESSESSSSDNLAETELHKNGNATKRRRKRGRRKSESHSQHHGPEKKSTMAQKEVQRKRDNPSALHPDIGFNEPGQLNDGPHCKCSWSAKLKGIRHDKFAGEQFVPKCDLNSSNIECLHHYVLVLDPKPGCYSRCPTAISLDGHVYEFDGFSVFFHQPLPDHFPQQPINQWTNDFQVRLVKENMPESFTIRDLELFHTYLFDNILELYDLNRTINCTGSGDKKPCFFYHCLPRFSRTLPDDGKELLPMSAVLSHFLRQFFPLTNDQMAKDLCADPKAFANFAQEKKGQICINPAKRPLAIRADLIDSYDSQRSNRDFYPLLTHFGVKPSAYAFSKRPQYQEALRNHIRFRKGLLCRKIPLTSDENRLLNESEANVQRLKLECVPKRETTIHINSRGFYSTGFYADIVQHALLLVLFCHHARFHCSLKILEQKRIQYIFRNRALLELALIHPSFRANYGTNPDHAKNTIINCGLRMGRGGTTMNREQQRHAKGATTTSTEPSKSVQQQQSTRKRGIQALMEIMSMQGNQQVTESPLRHNERLEFLGDAVVEFLTTVHLFFLFDDLDEGGLATFRSALVQNRHLATLADRVGLQEFMVYAHGPDLCHETDLRHAMANAFEALMAAIFLDSNLEECDRIFSNVLFKDDAIMKQIWTALPEHPLKRNNSFGDRQLIEKVPCLKLLSEFEGSIGIRFKHIRLLAKAFTRRNVPYNYLTLGNNQRLEFLGDTVLQLLTTEYLYKHFPHHQEGHLSLLRTCLVSNKTQSVVCDELSMTRFLIIPKVMLRKCPQAQLRLKDKADLNEAFIGALFVDRGLIYCRQFCRTCFFPRLKYFIVTQRWNDPKSQLQQCCLALREGGAGEPDIPEYKTIGIEGPTNTRVYRVAVYFRNKRMADGIGSNVHQAQMQAAQNALEKHSHLFPAFVNKSQNQKSEIAQNERKQTAMMRPKRVPPPYCNERKQALHNKLLHTTEEKGGNFETPKIPNGRSTKNHCWRSLKRPREQEDEDNLRSNSKQRPPKELKSATSSLSDKRYWSPRLEAINQAFLKSQRQKGEEEPCKQKNDYPCNRLKFQHHRSGGNPTEQSHFYFNNGTPQNYQPPKASLKKSEENNSSSVNGGDAILLPPPPPPPELPSSTSSSSFTLLLEPPPPPPKLS